VREAVDSAGSADHGTESAHLPTTAKTGLRTQGLIIERGHAESAKQTAPSPLVSEITAGSATSKTKIAPSTVVMTALRDFAFGMGSSAYSRYGARLRRRVAGTPFSGEDVRDGAPLGG
jgi:hypothetical protein